MADSEEIDYKALYEEQWRRRVAELEEQRRREEEQRRRIEELEEQHRREKELRRRAEEQAQEREQLMADLQRKYEESLYNNQPTDFRNYLLVCHQELFLKMSVQTDASLASKGLYTKVNNKFYPLELAPWTDFLSLHDKCQRRLEAVFHDERHFPSPNGLQVIRDFLREDPVADEQDIRNFQFLAVEGCSKKVFQEFLRIQASPNEVDEATKANESDEATEANEVSQPSSSLLPDNIKFINSPYGLLSANDKKKENLEGPAYLDGPAYVPAAQTACADDAQSRGRNPNDDGPPPAKHTASPTRAKLYPDQWCFRVDGEAQVPLFVVEYKAAHKLRASHIHTALTHTQGAALFQDVVRELGHPLISQDDEENTIVQFKRMTAQVLVQAFHYMIDFGLQYCYVTSGEALILLYLDPDHPLTLYYHFAVPRNDVQPAAGVDADPNLRETAVALVSTMVLLALETRPLSQRWKQNTSKLLKQWPEPYPEAGTSSSRGDDGTDGDYDRRFSINNPPSLRPRRQTDGGGCKDPIKGKPKDDPDDSDDSDDKKDKKDKKDKNFRPTRTTSASPNTARVTRSSSKRSNRTSGTKATGTADGGHSRAVRAVDCGAERYCTHACLLGLRDGGPLDRLCPNVQQHKKSARSGTSQRHQQQHPVSYDAFMQLLRQQLADDLDNNCEALDKFGKFGAIGLLFRLTLQPFGYCVAAKGVQTADWPRLQDERHVYDVLRAQQGVLVPACLGTLDLEQAYWASTGAHVTHMLLLSYGGEPLWKRKLVLPDDIDNRLEQLWEQLQKLGVDHGDVRLPNVLWNTTTQQLLAVDFDWATIQTGSITGATAAADGAVDADADGGEDVTIAVSPLRKRKRSVCCAAQESAPVRKGTRGQNGESGE